MNGLQYFGYSKLAYYCEQVASGSYVLFDVDGTSLMGRVSFDLEAPKELQIKSEVADYFKRDVA